MLFSLPKDLLPDIHIGLGHDVLRGQFSKCQRRELYADLPEGAALLQRGKENTFLERCDLLVLGKGWDLSGNPQGHNTGTAPPNAPFGNWGIPLDQPPAGELVSSLNEFLHLHVFPPQFYFPQLECKFQN